jgi:nucleoside-diphosphate-sugar epimerase
MLLRTMSAAPRSVFVTGASGFIGAAVAERFREAGAAVRGIDRIADERRGVVAGDVSVAGAWQRAVEGAELVVHTAALVSFRGDARRFWEVNVLGTRRVLDAAARAGVARVVHLSSVTAFGFDFPDGADERWPVRTNGSPYVDTKVAGEAVVLAAHAAGEVACTVIRPGDVYGPRSRPWTVLPVEMLRAGRMFLPAGGRGIFSPVYVDNLIDGIVLAAASPAAAGHVFTITDDAGVTTREFFGRYATLLGVPPPRSIPTGLAAALAAVAGPLDRLRDPASELNPMSARYLARRGTYSIDKARRVLGYAPRIRLDEGFDRTAGWLREQGLIP